MDFVQDQQGAALVLASLQPGNVPLLFEPGAIPQGWLISGCVVGRELDCGHDLPDQRSFAGLARPRQYLHEAALFPQPLQQLIVNGLAYHNLLNALSILTQLRE